MAKNDMKDLFLKSKSLRLITLSILMFLTLFLVSLAKPHKAEAAAAQLAGWVTDQNGAFLNGAVVTLTAGPVLPNNSCSYAIQNGSYNYTTSSTGAYVFGANDYSQGICCNLEYFSVQATWSGHSSGPISVSGITNGATTWVNIVIYVAPPPMPNLISTNTTLNGTFYEDLPVSFGATIQNNGTANAGATTTQFLVCSGNNTCVGGTSPPNVFGSNIATSSLTQGASQSRTSGTWTAQRGNYTLRAWADINDSVNPELNNLDNGSWRNFCVEGKPDSPTLISPSNGSSGNSINPTLYWTFGNYNNTCFSAIGHRIDFGTTNPPPSGSSVNGAGPITGEYNPGTLLNNTTYFWRVVKCNGLSCNFGPVWSFTTVALTPTPTPTGVPAPTSPPTPTPTPPPGATPTPTPVPCQVTTSPSVLNLTAGGATGAVTASVTSGLGGATINQMRFGSYNTSVATVNPTSDPSSPYSTIVTPLAGGTTAVWATADLSDGRTCESTGSIDTDVNVTGPTPTFTPTPVPPTPTPGGSYSITLNVPTRSCSGTNSLVHLTWSTSGFSTSWFDIFSTGFDPFAVDNNSVGNFWNSGALSYNQTYTFRVQNHDWDITGGSPAVSNSRSITTLDCLNPPTATPTPPPATPTPTPTYSISGLVYIDSNNDGIQTCSGSCNNGSGDERSDTVPVTTLTRTGTGTTVANTSSGNYSFTGLTGGNYDITLTPPAGYIKSSDGLSDTNLNPRTVNVPNANVSGIKFGIIAAPTNTPTPTPTNTPTNTVSGNVFIDTNRNGAKDAGEVNYTAGTSTVELHSIWCFEALAKPASSTGDGTYSFTLVPDGTYTLCYLNLPSGYRMISPTNGPPPYFLRAVNFSTINSNINFAIAPYGPWIQSTGTDIRVDTGFNNYMPPSGGSCPSPKYASVDGAGLTPGIIFSGDKTPVFGQGQASFPNWRVGSNTYHELYTPVKGNVIRTSYNYVNAQIKQANLTPTPLTTTQCGASGLTSCVLLPALTHGLYIANGNMTLSGPGSPKSYTFPANSDYLILVNGDLTIDSRILVPTTSTVTFIVSGDITIDPSVGNTTGDITTTTSHIEGFYSADGYFIMPGISSCPATADKRLNIAGSVIVNAGGTGGTFQNQRDLCAGNTSCPVFSIKERPDFILNAPDLIKYKNTIYQEIAP